MKLALKALFAASSFVVLLLGFTSTLAQTLVSCTRGSETINFNPPITSVSQNSVSYKTSGDFSSCSGRYTSATSSAQGTYAIASCFLGTNAILSTNSHGSMVLTWNTGETSTVSYMIAGDIEIFPGMGIISYIGTVTAGVFTGALYAGTAAQPSIGGTCANGITSLTNNQMSMIISG